VGIHEYQINYQTPPVVKNIETISQSCTDNHHQIYRKSLHLPYVCVLEDDVSFPDIPKFWEAWRQVLHFCQSDTNWDFIYLGHFPWKIGKKIIGLIYESVSWCTHAYIISNRGMKYMLKYTPQQIMNIGRLAVPSYFDYCFPEGGGIDTFMAYSTYIGKTRSLAVVPMVVTQYSIPRWPSMARSSEYLSRIVPGWWPHNIALATWIIYWIVLYLLVRRFS
jgi:hypothetical protein